ncbi:MAG: hypothetical protein ACREE2_07415 [Stellaceae bacterium]
MALLFPPKIAARSEETSLAWTIVPFLVSLISNFYLSYPTKVALCLSVAVIVVMAASARLIGPRRLPDVLLVLSLGWLMIYSFQSDYKIIGGDLLPIVQAAAHNMIHGQDPYTADYSAVTSNLFYYLPLQWLPFMPTAALAADPRLVNVLAFIAIVLLTRVLIKDEGSLTAARSVLFPVLFSHLFTLAAARSYMGPYWGLVYLFVIALTTQRDVWAAVLLGLLLASRQTALALAAATLAGVVRYQSPIRLLQLAAVTIGIAGLVLGPFIIWHHSLLYETFLRLPEQELVKVLENPVATAQIGIMPILRHIGLPNHSLFVQAIIAIFTLGLIAVRCPDDRTTLTILIGAMDLVMIAAGGQVFEYYFGTGLLIVSSALMFPPRPLTSPGADFARTSWRGPVQTGYARPRHPKTRGKA